MPSLDDVYRKFGETAEAAQLIETELGTMLLAARCIEEGLLEKQNPALATDILDSVNRHTLGQLFRNLKNHTKSLDALENLILMALSERNRLLHAFYRSHNFRRNSDEGRAFMLEDLGTIHCVLLEAYKAIMKANGTDLDGTASIPLPTRHVRI